MIQIKLTISGVWLKQVITMLFSGLVIYESFVLYKYLFEYKQFGIALHTC